MDLNIFFYSSSSTNYILKTIILIYCDLINMFFDNTLKKTVYQMLFCDMWICK